MPSILHTILTQNRCLAILIDPEKTGVALLPQVIPRIQIFLNQAMKQLHINACMLFVGGSTMEAVDLDAWIDQLKKLTPLSIVIFPGSHEQLSEGAHALLFLNLLSGRNPDYLVSQQVQAASKLKNSKLEIIPTAYLLIDGGKESAVQRVSNTLPMSQQHQQAIVDTAFAGQLMGNRLIYLEAGSGASTPVLPGVIKAVCDGVSIPVIAGGGMRDFKTMQLAFEAGARMVVVGTALENNHFF